MKSRDNSKLQLICTQPFITHYLSGSNSAAIGVRFNIQKKLKLPIGNKQ